MDKWEERRSGINDPRQNDGRDPFERDRARMIHSSSFRRLQAKTQVLGVGESDFYRTRLTHSLEVAQIGSGIVKQLKKSYPAEPWIEHLPTESLIETICLAHDLGHPPFGHGGEIALNYMMRNNGGFEGNGQTLRIISKLDKYTENYGLDLTRRTMLGVLKYPVSYEQVCSEKHKDPDFLSKNYDSHRQIKASEWKPPKCFFNEDLDIIDWVFSPLNMVDRERFTSCNINDDKNKHNKSQYKSFDTTIMDLSDDIAYGIHDLEDAISLDLVGKEVWENEVEGKLKKSGSSFNGMGIEEIKNGLFSENYHERKYTIGGLVNWLITSAIVEQDHDFNEPLLKYKLALPKEDAVALETIKDFVINNVVKSHSVQLLEYKGQQMVMAIFESIISDPERLLPKSTIIKWSQYKENSGCDSGARVVSDYVSGMTDDYAIRIYKSLFVAGDGSIFHKH